MTVEQAMSLSPEEAKAIAIARAAVERDNFAAGYGAPQIMEFKVRKTDTGWSVYVGFVGLWDQGRPYKSIGNFCTVELDRDWQVRRVMGGA